MRWLIWDKGQKDFSLADFEMAWTSQNRAARRLVYHRSKAVKEGGEHPTQKPVELMKWCISFLDGKGVILDPFAGSFSTGVACAKLGREFIGIERDESYFNIGIKRITEAYAQSDLFVSPPIEQEQNSLL